MTLKDALGAGVKRIDSRKRHDPIRSWPRKLRKTARELVVHEDMARLMAEETPSDVIAKAMRPIVDAELRTREPPRYCLCTDPTMCNNANPWIRCRVQWNAGFKR